MYINAHKSSTKWEWKDVQCKMGFSFRLISKDKHNQAKAGTSERRIMRNLRFLSGWENESDVEGEEDKVNKREKTLHSCNSRTVRMCVQQVFMERWWQIVLWKRRQQREKQSSERRRRKKKKNNAGSAQGVMAPALRTTSSWQQAAGRNGGVNIHQRGSTCPSISRT